MISRWDALARELDARRAQHLYRSRRINELPQGPEQRIDGKSVLGFCSNDYLGLAADPRVSEAMAEGARRFGVGSGAAHLINGHSSAHHALEEELAAFTGRQRALLFSTGYMANVGVIAALAARGDSVFQDRLNHASLLDGARLSGARLQRYKHSDVDALEEQLTSSRRLKNSLSLRETSAWMHEVEQRREQLPGAWVSGSSTHPRVNVIPPHPHLLPEGEGKKITQHAAGDVQKKLIATDGVFSMDGDLAPLPQLVACAERHHAWLMLDDAHGLGVLGAHGGGCCEYFGLDAEAVPILVGTLGKAFGTFGAFVAGDETLIEYLIQNARSYIYTTALPPAVAHATRISLHLVREESWRRARLQSLIARFRDGATTLNLPLLESFTPIQPLLIGDTARAMHLSEALYERGILISAIRPPTVPEGSARLRITFTANHTEQQVDRLLETLERVL